MRRVSPGCRIILVTAFGTIKNAVEATKLGAYAYLEKPVNNEELLLLISRALEVRKLEAEVAVLKSELLARYRFSSIVGTSARMNSIFQIEDIPLLCEHFFKKYAAELGKEIRGVAPDALQALLRYAWPGNVRELENVIYESMVLSDDPVLDERSLPARIRGGFGAAGAVCSGESLRGAAQAAAGQAEKTLIEKALREAGGNRTLAAKALGISRKTLFNKMKSQGIGDE